MRITADTSRCVGAGQCVLAAPDIFDQDDEDGTVVLRAAHIPADLLADVQVAVDVCPSRALALVADAAAAREPAGR